jgi:hypothetical protein
VFCPEHQKYQGSRYSFGYPACPNLEDQTKLFALLHRRKADDWIPVGAGAVDVGDRGASSPGQVFRRVTS